LVTAIAALLTIREMKRQRESSYKPAIILIEPTFSISVRGAKPEEISIAHHWVVTGPSISPSARRWETPVLECVNAGAGPANRIEWQWSYDIDTSISLVKSCGPLSFELERDAYSLTFREPGVIRMFDLRARKHTHAFAGGGAGSAFPIHVPTHYLIFVGLRAYTLLQTLGSKADVSAALGQFPRLTLQLNYHDLAGTVYREHHTFVLQPVLQKETPVTSSSPLELILEGHIAEASRSPNVLTVWRGEETTDMTYKEPPHNSVLN
jgi:hypothetical protein